MTPDRTNAEGFSVSDEQFVYLLTATMGSEGTPAEDNEVRQLASALHSYRQEQTLWAERRSAGQPSLAEKAQHQARWGYLPRWSLALIALVTIAGGVTHVVGTRSATDAPDASVVSTVDVVEATTPADIAADNHLLNSIDAELSYHAASPVDALRLKEEAADLRGDSEEMN